MIKDFAADIANGRLPQVSWVIAPSNTSEHASWHPADGEDFSARLIKELENNPEVYAKTVFILNYDEGGQFYDHHWSPTPPVSESDGISTVSTKGEPTDRMFPNTQFPWTAPMGLGFRVPLLIVSPWTRGNIVLSQVFDHTSVIKLIESRFNVSCPNISPWRRMVTGDMTAAFDWDHPNYTWPTLPDTSSYPNDTIYQCEHLPKPEIPATQTYPQQEPGTRISRALPYEFVVSDALSSSQLSMQLAVTGLAGSAFTLFDRLNLKTNAPQKYAVEAGKAISANLNITSPGAYAFQLHGPNGTHARVYLAVCYVCGYV